MPEYEEIGGLNEIWKPLKKGDKLVGKVLQIYEGQYGQQADIQASHGVYTTPAHVSLQRAISQLAQGDQVVILFDGTGTTKTGQKFQRYIVKRVKK